MIYCIRLISLLIMAGAVFGGWIIWESQQDYKGANMILMGLPMVAMPMTFLGILNSIFLNKKQLKSGLEKSFHTVLIIVTIIPYIFLYILG